MAYGNKYSIQYYDWFGTQTTIYISERNYSGAVTELEPAADPLVISLKADNNDIFSPIKQTSAEINVISETDFQLLDLFSGDSKKFRVEVQKGGSSYWWGYLISDQYQEPYKQPMYAVKLYATDGLGWLKSLPFTEVEVLITGSQTLLTVISICLYTQLEWQLDIYEAINTYEDNIDQTVADSVLDQIYIDFTKFNKFYTDYSCYDLLEYILRPFNAYILQVGGRWGIIQIPTNRASYTVRRWVFDSGFYVYDTNAAYDPVVATTSNDVAKASLVRLVGNTLTMSPAWRGFTMTQDYSPLTQLVEGGDFPYEDFTLSGTWSNSNWTMFGTLTIQPKFTGIPIASTRHSRTNSITGLDTVSGVPSYASDPDNRISRSSPFNFSNQAYNKPFQGDTGLEIVTTAANIGAAGCVYQEYDVVASATDHLIFRFEYGILLASASWQNYIEIRLDGASTKYLDSAGAWQVAQTYITFSGAAGENFNEQKEVRTASIPIDGTIRIRLFELVTAGSVTDFIWHKVYMYYLPDGEGLYNSKVRNIVLDNANNYTPSRIEMVFGDVPAHDNNELCYGTALYWNDSGTKTCTEDWETSQELLDIAANVISRQYAVPRQTITGTIYSKLIDWSTIIQEINNSNRKFMINMGSYNDRNGAWDVTLCQLISTQNQITSWTNTSWTTFTRTGTLIQSAINSSGAALATTNIIGHSIGDRYALRWEADAVDADGYFSIGGQDVYIDTVVGTRLITCTSGGNNAYFEMDNGDTGTFTNITFYLYPY